GIGRILKVDNSGAPSPIGALGTIDDTAIGWGVSASGVYESGPSRFTAMATTGEGIGRYVGLNVRDDVLVSPTNQLDTPLLYAGFVSYRYAFAANGKLLARYLASNRKRRASPRARSPNRSTAAISIFSIAPSSR
ncbi:MAG: hypothetical protein HC853_15205, partial [Anaerolineae bacterium]|nr:hypothetical protein [Anaerolineae bacterium]